MKHVMNIFGISFVVLLVSAVADTLNYGPSAPGLLDMREVLDFVFSGLVVGAVVYAAVWIVRDINAMMSKSTREDKESG